MIWGQKSLQKAGNKFFPCSRTQAFHSPPQMLPLLLRLLLVTVPKPSLPLAMKQSPPDTQLLTFGTWVLIEKVSDLISELHKIQMLSSLPQVNPHMERIKRSSEARKLGLFHLCTFEFSQDSNKLTSESSLHEPKDSFSYAKNSSWTSWIFNQENVYYYMG